MVDRVFQEMEALGEQDILAIFISDNGYLLGEHGISQDKRLPYQNRCASRCSFGGRAT